MCRSVPYPDRGIDTIVTKPNSRHGSPVMTRAMLTYRDYEVLPRDGRRYEIHDGKLSVTPAPTPQHQILSARLFIVLSRWVEASHAGLLLYAPLDVILSDTTIVQPDIVYLAPDRLHLVSRRGIEGPPTLAVEILSPSTRAIDRVTKPRVYARHGVPHLWLVDPETRAVEAFTLQRHRYTLTLSAAGPAPVDLPPCTGLHLVPDTLWPEA
jgi:Uma2 family endonuclease